MLERQIRDFEKKKIEIVLVLNDGKFPKRKDYLLEMVNNIARKVARLLANHPRDYDEVKVVLCMFEIQYYKIDDWKYQIENLKHSKER